MEMVLWLRTESLRGLSETGSRPCSLGPAAILERSKSMLNTRGCLAYFVVCHIGAHDTVLPLYDSTNRR